jgi:hypothetical protein
MAIPTRPNDLSAAAGATDALAAMGELGRGFARWRRLREEEKNREILIACDNDIVMMFARPTPFHLRQLRALFADGGEFPADLQAVSLTERMAAHLFQSHIDSPRLQKERWTLPGHHHELFGLLDQAFHATLDEGAPGVEPEQIASQVRSFRIKFYEEVLKGNIPSMEEVIAAIPGQMQSWLGFGSAALEWNRLQQLHRRKAMINVTTRFDSFVGLLEGPIYEQTKNFWRDRLEGSKPSLDQDAHALAALEILNREAMIPMGKLMVLVSGADHVWHAASKELAHRIGLSEENECAVLFRPWDVLDECHTHFTGTGDFSATGSLAAGRLSGALEVVFTGEERSPNQRPINEFRAAWNAFLHACVAERLKGLRWQKRTHVDRVLFVFRRIDDASGYDSLKSLLAQRGQEVMNQAAGLGLLRMQADLFARGAPLLYLDRHPMAQSFQMLSPETYIERLANSETLTALEQEENTWYTRHLLTARAYTWAGKWDVCLQLCKYALFVKDPIAQGTNTDAKGTESGASSKVNGREALFLLAVSERHAAGGTVKGIVDAKKALKQYDGLVEADQSLSESKRRLLRLRSRCESFAIELTSVFNEHFASADQAGADEQAESMTAMLERCIDDANRECAHWNQHDAGTERALCLGLLYQCHINLIQIRLLLFVVPRLSANEWRRLESVRIALFESMPGFAESRFSAALRRIAAVVIGMDKATDSDRIELLQLGEKQNRIFSYDGPRAHALSRLLDGEYAEIT